ncbi:MAG TPA: potassium channel family protein [Candidatus Nanoarchaeia archaeon]|nr:potassium channel family protein [Candidatus Nanoarchaeia archaeon]
MKTYSKIIVAVSALFTWIAIGTVLFHRLEAWSWIQAFYFSVATITTVGYGDLHPTTDLSRIVVSLYLLLGVSISLVSLTVIGSSLLTRHEKEVLQRARNLIIEPKRGLN